MCTCDNYIQRARGVNGRFVVFSPPLSCSEIFSIRANRLLQQLLSFSDFCKLSSFPHCFYFRKNTLMSTLFLYPSILVRSQVCTRLECRKQQNLNLQSTVHSCNSQDSFEFRPCFHHNLGRGWTPLKITSLILLFTKVNTILE